MKLLLQTLAAQDPSELEMDDQSTFADLKQAIRDSLSSAPFFLAFGENLLQPSDDRVSLAACGLSGGSMLNLIKRVPAVITGSIDGTAKLWNVATGECTRTFSGHYKRLTVATFSPDGSSVLTASRDGTAVLWNTATGECTHTLQPRFGNYGPACIAAMFLPDNSSVLTVHWNNYAYLWNTGTGECMHTLYFETTVSFQGKKETTVSFLACGALSPDGSSVILGSTKGAAKLWNVATGKCTQTLQHARLYAGGHARDDIIISVAISADGSSALTASEDKTAKLWDVVNGECTMTFSGHRGPLRRAIFSADDSSVLTACFDQTAKLWDAVTGECTMTFSGHSHQVIGAAFSADGSSVLTASVDKTAKLWDVVNGECTMTFSGHSDVVTGATFSADGGSVLTASRDNTAKIWELATGECTQTLCGHTANELGYKCVISAEFEP